MSKRRVHSIDEDASGLSVCVALSGVGEKVVAFARSPDARIHRVECISNAVEEGNADVDTDVLMLIRCNIREECTCKPGCGELQKRLRE